jgi:dCMP deaminase
VNERGEGPTSEPVPGPDAGGGVDRLYGIIERTDPHWARHDFYMRLALVVESGAKCLGSRVGAVAVRDNRVLGMGYNGTPSGYPNCTETERGCLRCAIRRQDPTASLAGKLYDICLCVHAEQNVIATAARFGVPLADAWLYTTLQPCFLCLKEMMQAGITGIVFRRPWMAHHPDYGWVEDEYRRLVHHFRSRGSVLAQLRQDKELDPVRAAIGGPD